MELWGQGLHCSEMRRANYVSNRIFIIGTDTYVWQVTSYTILHKFELLMFTVCLWLWGYLCACNK
jgi:hypothetical protein